MDWFGKKKAAAEREALEIRLAKMEAIAICANALVFSLVKTATAKQRENIATVVGKFVAEKMRDTHPGLIPEKYHQNYRDELSRSLQILLKFIKPADNEKGNAP